VWIASLEDKLTGRAALFYKTKAKPTKMDEYLKMFDDKYASPTALAEYKEKLDLLVQTNPQSCEEYLSLKIASMSLLPALTEAEKLVSAKKGLLPEYRSQVVAADSMEKLVAFALEIDRIKPVETVNAFQKKKFTGNCFYCKKTGHREAECRKKKNDARSNGGRMNGSRPGYRMNAMERDSQETVQILDVPPTNKTSFMYDCKSVLAEPLLNCCTGKKRGANQKETITATSPLALPSSRTSNDVCSSTNSVFVPIDSIFASVDELNFCSDSTNDRKASSAAPTVPVGTSSLLVSRKSRANANPRYELVSAMTTDMPESFIKIANKSTKGGWDTGASISAISKKMYDCLPELVRSKYESNNTIVRSPTVPLSSPLVLSG
jgi:hypothetical protein